MIFPRKNGHAKKLEMYPDNTPKGFFDSRRNVFSACYKKFQYTQKQLYGLDPCCDYGLYANAHRGKMRKASADPLCPLIIEDEDPFIPSRFPKACQLVLS